MTHELAAKLYEVLDKVDPVDYPRALGIAMAVFYQWGEAKGERSEKAQMPLILKSAIEMAKNLRVKEK